MESTSGEIILHDLLAWEPRLTVVSPRPGSAARSDALQRDVEWVVTARATAPMLPSVRGGELIILPHRIVQETGIPVSRLVHEMMLHPIAGILTDEPMPDLPASGVAMITMPDIDADTESALNRLLASRRRELLAIASDVDRLFGNAQAGGERPADVMGKVEDVLGIPVHILAGDGAVYLSSAKETGTIERQSASEWVGATMRSGKSLWLGPVPPDLHARARMTAAHVRDGLQRMLDREASSMGRGGVRMSALHALLFPAMAARPDVIADVAYQAGIPPGRVLRVALASAGQESHFVRHALSPLGELHDAGSVDGMTVLVVVAPPSGVRAMTSMEGQGAETIAISGPVAPARELAEATRQARYVAGLLGQGAIPGPIARFDDEQTLGLYRVLYPLWGSAGLAHYCSNVLGDLRREDRHGVLIDTLRVFLEEGGSLRPSAERLGIHRNTLAYRMRHIRAVIGADLDSPRTRLGLQVALVADALPGAPDS